MVKKKTPEYLKRARESLRKFHNPDSMTERDHIEPWSTEVDRPPTVGAWSRTHPLLEGLQSAIPNDRFNVINEALLSVDQLTIMVENLRETSRADVLSRAASGAGGLKGGRGYKADGTGKQASDEEILRTYTAIKGNGARKLKKTVIADTMLHLKQQGKEASESRIQKLVVEQSRRKQS